MRQGPTFANVDEVANRTETRAPRASRELALLALLYVGYSAARLLADADVPTATANAHGLLDLESALHLDVEHWANSWLSGV